MKLITIVIFLLFFGSIAHGQTKEFDPDKLDYRYIKINNKQNKGHERLQYRSVSVLDARSDTTKIGYWQTFQNPDYVKLDFKDGSEGLEHFYTIITINPLIPVAIIC